MKKYHLSICIVIVLLFSAVFTVFGENEYELVVPYGSPPTVDGALGVGEWDDSVSVSVNGSYPVDNQVAFLKFDGECLYIGFNISDSTVYDDKDYAHLAIDVNHDSGINPQTDDIAFAVLRNGTVKEVPGTGPPTTIPRGWNAAAWNEGNNTWTAEFNITYAKIGITSGEQKTLGILISIGDAYGLNGIIPIYDYDNDVWLRKYYDWPPGALGQGGEYWGDLISEENWIPEFPSSLILPLFMIATLFVIIYRRELKQPKSFS